MDTLKTAVVLVLLLAMGYGVWVVLNQETIVEDPQEVGWGDEMVIEDGMSEFGDGPKLPPLNSEFQPGVDDGAGLPGDASQVGYGAPAGPAYGSESHAAPEVELPPPPPGFPASEETDPNASPLEDSRTEAGVDPPPQEVALGDRFPAEPVGEPIQAGPVETGPVETGPVETGPAETVSLNEGEFSSPPPANSTPLVYEESRYGTEGAATAETRPEAPPIAQGPIATDSLAKPAFAEAKATADQQARQGHFYDALYTLSLVHGDPGLTEDERRTLLDRLDYLAGRVIYSPEHLLEPPYQVQRGETLQQIADRYKVPIELLRNINGVKSPDLLTPGSMLKVVHGPFRAEVNLRRNEMTLFLGRLYAGRFPITVGREPSPAPGKYQIRGKETGKAYYSANGVTFTADHPSNPYGRHWLDMGNQVCIHGTASTGANSGLGCISLSPRDALDVYGILSQGSEVEIRH